jgi:hypothetical protein
MPERGKEKGIPEEIIGYILKRNAVTVAVAAFFLSSGKEINKSGFRLKIKDS